MEWSLIMDTITYPGFSFVVFGVRIGHGIYDLE
jgi:hypothetical protein